ncbi:MAG: citryl-CoA lyase [Pirellulales bacterium]
MSDFWKTSISRVRPNEILVRGYSIEDLASKCTFGDVVYLLLTGELPAGNEGRLVEAILVTCCEHSLASPSVDAVRFVASSGVPLQTAVAAGVSSIGDIHGGAIEPCARLIKDAVERGQTARALLEDLKRRKQRMPGFGHALHHRDPRAPLLQQLAEKWSLLGPHSRFLSSIEAATEEVFGRRLPPNVDGAIAGLMCDMNIDPALGKAFFIIGRAPGYVAHAHEQVTAERPFKAADYDEITYTGPGPRPVPLPPEK